MLSGRFYRKDYIGHVKSLKVKPHFICSSFFKRLEQNGKEISLHHDGLFREV